MVSTSASQNSPSASEIPAGIALITGGLYLRCKLESGYRYGISSNKVPGQPSRPLNGYSLPSGDLKSLIAALLLSSQAKSVSSRSGSRNRAGSLATS